MYQFLHSLRRSSLLLSLTMSSLFFLSSCADKVELVSPSELTQKQKVELQLTSGSAKSWDVSVVGIKDVFEQNKSIMNKIPPAQFAKLQGLVKQETEGKMGKIIFTLVGKYEMRDDDNNITESGYWQVNTNGNLIGFTPKNGGPVKIFEIQMKENAALTIYESSNIVTNIDNDPEPESITVETAVEFN